MLTKDIETAAAEEKSSCGDWAADAARHAAQLSQDARELKSRAAKVVGEGVEAAKHAFEAVRGRVGDVAQCRDEATDRLKQNPWRGVGLALGVGVGVGLAAGLLAHRFRRHD
jgi:ElaB/YqjD/DUF883 family membrane-anchored ribosome-binding protein